MWQGLLLAFCFYIQACKRDETVRLSAPRTEAVPLPEENPRATHSGYLGLLYELSKEDTEPGTNVFDGRGLRRGHPSQIKELWMPYFYI
ncbi:unnamed protein product [Arctogadus glacialis]